MNELEQQCKEMRASSLNLSYLLIEKKVLLSL